MKNHLLPRFRFLTLTLKGLKKLLASKTGFKSMGPLTISDPDISFMDYKLGWITPIFFYSLFAIVLFLFAYFEIIIFPIEDVLEIYSRA